MIISILLDTCALCPPKQEDKNAIVKLFELEDAGKIEKMEIAEATEEELAKLNKIPNELKNRIDGMIICLAKAHTQNERSQIKQMETLLFPNKKNLSISDSRDVLILFTAFKYGHTHLITANTKHFIENDKSKKLFNLFKIKTMTPDNCLKDVSEHLIWYNAHSEKMAKLRQQA